MSTYRIKPIHKLNHSTKRRSKILLAIMAALLALGVVVSAMAMVSVFGILLPDQEDVAELDGTAVDFGDIQISKVGEGQIPKEYIPIYKAAGEKYNIPWTLIAAIHRVETNFGQDLNTSSVGAIGHTQFMVKTWVGWSFPGGTRLGDASIPKETLMSPAAISKYGGFGVDGDGDGKADPYNVTDAMYSTANYLAANGGASGNYQKAVFAYNHASWYVSRVMGFMKEYTSGSVEAVSIKGGSAKGSEAIEKAIKVGSSIVGKSPYVWGGGRNQGDINARKFDCSSYVRWAYSSAGVDLGPVSATTTDTLVKLGKVVKASEMKRGDVIFFDTYKINGHVGIYLGDGKFLNDSSSQGVSVGDLNTKYWKDRFNGNVRRVA
ncbi:bifunctional lytic transglycosylase/C40 family peptidase [Priestia aryabhattai]|uniref:bifunctional lytic transglycosylase/C40 family peptidase n=1 Tax=Priestia TaxID=2800373 RepID=UPI00234F9D4C|nr:bifunctional lytic transglycosylase/C40 family peptidase [Priestia aryabhattai]MDC7767292.1 bifunctional lytic transglycosylase/C40 family peptidase [Priestia aryabhattai]